MKVITINEIVNNTNSISAYMESPNTLLAIKFLEKTAFWGQAFSLAVKTPVWCWCTSVRHQATSPAGQCRATESAMITHVVVFLPFMCKTLVGFPATSFSSDRSRAVLALGVYGEGWEPVVVILSPCIPFSLPSSRSLCHLPFISCSLPVSSLLLPSLKVSNTLKIFS